MKITADNPIRKNYRGFTLVELLIVIAILAVLAAAVVIVLNPAELLAQARDGQRSSDMKTVGDALAMLVVDNPSANLGTQKTVYLSIPSASAPSCDIAGLPSLPSGWSYNCAAPQSLTNVNGTGWLPIDFTTVKGGSPIPALPTDPTNNGSFFYSYTPGAASMYSVSSKIESVRHRQQNQSGIFTTNFASGSNPQLSSIYSGGDWIRVPGDSAYNTQDFWVMKYEAKCVDAGGNPLYVPTEGTYQTYYDSSAPCVAGSNRYIASVKDGYPITRVSHNTAKTYCASIGAHLLTNEEYMTIVKNAEKQGDNWIGGSVGSNKLYRGHTDNAPASALIASLDSNAYAGTGNTAGSEQRRTAVLSSGETIWDISGNVWEHVMRTPADTQTAILTPSCDSGSGWQWCNYGTATTPYVSAWTADVARDYIGASNAAWDANNQNTGRVYTNSGASGGTVFLRGGRWADGTGAGLFAASMDLLGRFVERRCWVSLCPVLVKQAWPE